MSKNKIKTNSDFIVKTGDYLIVNSLDRKLNELIYTAVGAASMCWDSPRSAGVFNSKQASVIAEKLKDDIKDLIKNK